MKTFKIILLSLLFIGILFSGIIGVGVVEIIKEAPEIDPTTIISSLNQTSTIYDLEGNLVEKIQAEELRTVVSINKMPKYLLDAFVAIEDERFYEHPGVDIKGIGAAMIDNIKSGSLRGGSTITQQLVKNVYLTNDVSITRKVKEAYLALQVEKVLTKDQILEAYLNRNYFGQNAYGVQEAARTYFSKDVEDLTLAESAMLAGIVKSTSNYQPYYRVKPDEFDPSKDFKVGEIEVLGEKYICVFNEKSVSRQRVVLQKMLELGKITQEQYDEAIKQDMKTSIKPEQKKITDITSYFTDMVKNDVVDKLMELKGYTLEQAQDLLYTGGLSIYSTIDLKMQRQLEDIYDNFLEILLGDTSGYRNPVLIDWSSNRSGDIVDSNGNIIFYKQSNLMTDDLNLILNSEEYSFDNGNLIINSKKITPYEKHFDIADFYTIDEKKNLITHSVGSVMIDESKYKVEGEKVVIDKSYLESNQNFFEIIDGNLILNNEYYYVQKDGIVQPQSATITIDYKTGYIKAVVGGRDVKGSRILNRATDSQRQPGSAIKPIAVYWPALNSDYTAASIIDDVPFYNSSGELWPKNWYSGYRGLHTLRKSVEQSVNVNSVKVLKDIGIDTSMAFLDKLGINDSIVTSEENPNINDENLSALGLGGMSKGLTPLEITAAYGAIANKGVYVEPISFTKVLDKNGNVLIDNIPEENRVSSEQVAYIMGDILRTTVTNGIASKAKMPNMAVAGKTGTTQNQADIWFVGYTPYYVTGTWIGNDMPKITLSKSSSTAAMLWKHINTVIHEGLESKMSFPKPDGIVTKTICTQSGLLPSELCSRDPRGTIREEYFVSGTEPTTSCTTHVEVMIDKTNGKIANEFCPIENVESRVFIKRNPPYIPAENGGIVPSDYQYEVPTEICTDHNESTIVVPPIEEPQNPEEPTEPENPDDNGNSGGNNDNNGNDNNGNNNGEFPPEDENNP
ncbi:MAG TPA: PBP1A family penicillin-binding protein [Soehngenia sp.]|nr:PBP1A family penicillin-binding protein [Soehngenia sp.]